MRLAAQNMSDLIDDLLKLSRLTRADIHRSEVDLSQIALDVLQELGTRDPDRDVEVVVHPGLLVRADERFLVPAMRNLLENAWKFTARVPKVRIEVGSIAGHDGAEVFFVRDNGVGFDMAYAERLFGAFQRLHSRKDFEGSGIGLAIVRRVINKHGGRIWAEAAVDHGATFFFTLPELQAET